MATGTPTSVPPTMSLTTLSAWPCMTSISARSRSRWLVGQVCPYNMLDILSFILQFRLCIFAIFCMHLRQTNISYLSIVSLVITMCFLNFTHITFLLRTRPRGSLFFEVDALEVSTLYTTMVLHHPASGASISYVVASMAWPPWVLCSPTSA
jgi:hypothetical protein